MIDGEGDICVFKEGIEEEMENKEIKFEERVLYGSENFKEEYKGMVMKYAEFDEKIKRK